MKKFLIAAVCCCITIPSFAQIIYESGYVINNRGERSSVLIKNVDWRNNPNVIEYKISESSEAKTATVKDIQEFGIGESSKYVRHTVQLDQSGDNVKSLSRSRNPEYKEETVFLKVLIEGQADLLRYTDDSRNRFLYSVDDQPVEQLIFKKYQSSTGTRRGTNNYFRQQVMNNLTCPGTKLKDLENLNYSENALRSLFKNYNECIGSTYLNYGVESAKGSFNFKVKAGIDYVTFKIHKEGNHYTSGRHIDFENQFNPRLGIEVEYILPFNKNKWSVFTEPSFQQLNVEKYYPYYETLPNYGTTARFSTKVLGIPIALRHYFFLSDNSKLLISGGYVGKFFFDTKGKTDEFYENEDVRFVNLNQSLEFGAGYALKDKYSVELKYGTGHDYFSESSLWKLDRSQVISLVFGYTIF